MSDSRVAAYTAGVFDGEGNVHIGNEKNGHKLQIQVVNTYRPLLEWLQRQWGGGIYEMIPGRPAHWSRCWGWHLTNTADRQRFLTAIQPYSIVKHHAVEIALAWCETAVGQYSGKRLSSAAIKRRAELYAELHDPPRFEVESATALSQQLDLGMEA